MLHWDKDPAVECQADPGEVPKVVNHSVQESQVFGTGHQAASLRGTPDYYFVPWGGTFGDGICCTRWVYFGKATWPPLHLSASSPPPGSFFPQASLARLSGFSSAPGARPHVVLNFSRCPREFLSLGRGWSLGRKGRGAGAWCLEGHVSDGSLVGWFGMEISLLLTLTLDSSLLFTLEDP